LSRLTSTVSAAVAGEVAVDGEDVVRRTVEEADGAVVVERVAR
jgi:hypothetical protein